MPTIIVEIRGDGAFLIGNPFQARAEIAHFARLGDFGLAGERAEDEAATIEEANHAAIEGNYGSGLLHHRGEHMIEVEEIGVVQRYGGLFADGGEEEQVVFVEWSAVGFIDQLDDAEDVVFFAKWRAHPGHDFEFFARSYAFGETRFFRWVFD